VKIGIQSHLTSPFLKKDETRSFRFIHSSQASPRKPVGASESETIDETVSSFGGSFHSKRASGRACSIARQFRPRFFSRRFCV